MPPFLAELGSSIVPTRRDWLRVGVPSLLAATLPRLRADSRRPGFGRAKSVLVVFASGGQSQLDTWDPKPDAPVEIRGAFGSIPTAIPGVRFCEHLPQLAKIANHFSITRSVTHDDLDHGSACYLALTGQRHPQKSSNPPPKPTDFPALGAILKRVRPTDRFPQTAVHVNGPLLAPLEVSPGQYGGFLGRGYDPYTVGNVTETDALVEGFAFPENISLERAAARRKLVGELERHATPRLPMSTDQLTLARQAYDFLLSPVARDAFDLDREPAKLRERYGRHRSGQACLLARRLVEAGVPWVTVFFNHCIRGQDDHPTETDHYGWDTHNDIFDAMRTHLLPRFDGSVSALLEDLRVRGLLETTLVVVMGEFGRAPRVAIEKNFLGSSPGRKHWGGCYSVMLAGAGIRPGTIYGSSDRIAAYPGENPVTPGDLAATMFHALGIDPTGHFQDGTNRPYPLATGDPIIGLFG